MSAASAPTLLPVLDEHVLRSVPDGNGPYPGEIVAWQDRPATRVAAEQVGSGEMWRAEGEHVASILDILRTPEGHAVVLPQCTRSIIDLAAARAAGGQSFGAGELVTLVVSVLRGAVADQAAHGETGCRGDWWLDEDGVPLFVHADAGVPADRAATGVLHALISACEPDAATQTVLERAARTLGDPDRLPASAPAVEAALFGLAEPAPVGTQILARRARAASVPAAGAATVERPAWRRLADTADAGIAEMVSQAIAGARQRLTRLRGTRRPSRRGAALLAGACGALVLAAGLLWPTGDGDMADPAPRAPASTAAPNVTPSADATDGAASAAEDDPVPAVAAVLDAARDCAGESACVRPFLDEDSALWQEGSDLHEDGAAFGDAASRRLTLLDDVGGLVLVRADDTSGARPSQIVAAVRGEKKWLLRDIHDVAQQPG